MPFRNIGGKFDVGWPHFGQVTPPPPPPSRCLFNKRILSHLNSLLLLLESSINLTPGARQLGERKD